MRTSPIVRLVLLLGGAGVLVVLVRRVGTASLLALAGQVGWAFVWISALYAAHISLRAAALWRAITAGAPPYRTVLSALWSGEAAEVLTLAGPLAGEPAKALLLRQQGVDTTIALG